MNKSQKRKEVMYILNISMKYALTKSVKFYFIFLLIKTVKFVLKKNFLEIKIV